jgi:hypothetical protein
VTHTLSLSPILLDSHYRSDRGACGFVLVANPEVTPKEDPSTSCARRGGLRSLRRTNRLVKAKRDISPRRILPFFGFAEFGDYGEVFEGGGVAFDFAVGGEFAEQAAHDFAAAGFGQSFSEADVVGTGEGADLL